MNKLDSLKEKLKIPIKEYMESQNNRNLKLELNYNKAVDNLSIKIIIKKNI